MMGDLTDSFAESSANAVDEPYCKDMNKLMLEYFENSDHYDCSFRVGSIKGQEEVIKCHKLILAMSSCVFEKTFFGHFNETNRGPDEAIDFPHVEPDVFKAAMRFLYGNVEPKFSKFESALQMLEFAHKWQILALREIAADMCISFLPKTAQNILDLHQFFIVHNWNQHKKEFFENEDMLRRVNEMLPLLPKRSKEQLEDFLRQKTLNIFSERHLFDCLLMWGEFHRGKEDLKTVINPLLPLIRFQDFTDYDFGRLFNEINLFSDAEKLQIFIKRQEMLQRDGIVWRGLFRRHDVSTVHLKEGKVLPVPESPKIHGKRFELNFMAFPEHYILAVEMDSACFMGSTEPEMKIHLSISIKDGKRDYLEVSTHMVKMKDLVKGKLVVFNMYNPFLIKSDKWYTLAVEHHLPNTIPDVISRGENWDYNKVVRYKNDEDRKFVFEWGDDDVFSFRSALAVKQDQQYSIGDDSTQQYMAPLEPWDPEFY